MKKAILYVIFFIAVQLLLGLVANIIMQQFFPDNRTEVLLACSGITSAVVILTFVVFKWYKVNREYINTRPWLTIFWTFLLAIGTIIPLVRIEEIIPSGWLPNLIEEDMGAMLKSQTGYFIICMLAPLMEEVVFRGAIITNLRGYFAGKGDGMGNSSRYASTLAVVISALFFAAIHMNPAQMPHAFLVGLLLGWLFVNTNSIVLCFIVHWINNTTAYVLLNVFPHIPMDAKLSAYFGGSEMAVNQAVISSLLIAVPAIYQLHCQFKKAGKARK